MSVYRHALLARSASLSLVLALPLAAQTPEPPAPAQPSQPGVTTRMWVNGQEVTPDRFQMWSPRRGRLGVTVTMRARDTDSIGAYLVSVTPNGPASRAGLRSGDIIVRLDGKPVTSPNTAVDVTQPVPGIKLLDIASKLTPLDTVAVEFRRGTIRRTTQLITSDEPELSLQIGGDWMGGGGPDDNVPEFRFDQGPPIREHAKGDLRFVGPFRLPPDLADLELAPVNPDLGRYFGVTEGVLVIDVPAESRLKLKAGDVVVSCDGRPLTSPAHLLRILQSYESGEEIKLEVVRMKKRETIVGRIGYADPRMVTVPPR